jgi:hypothetical protein
MGFSEIPRKQFTTKYIIGHPLIYCRGMEKWRCGVINKTIEINQRATLEIKDCLGGGNDE